MTIKLELKLKEISTQYNVPSKTYDINPEGYLKSTRQPRDGCVHIMSSNIMDLEPTFKRDIVLEQRQLDCATEFYFKISYKKDRKLYCIEYIPNYDGPYVRITSPTRIQAKDKIALGDTILTIADAGLDSMSTRNLEGTL